MTDAAFVGAEPGTPERFALRVLTAREWCELPDPPDGDRLLGQLIVRRYRTVIGAATGEGKTTFALQALAALTGRGEFLGFQGAGGTALVIDLEQGERTIKRRLAEAGLAGSDAVHYTAVPDGLCLDTEAEHVAALELLLDELRPDVVLIDPLYKAHRGDSNDERAMVDLMRRLDAWREHFGFALVLPAHTRKPVEPGARLTIHDIFGSSAVVRGAELVLGLQRLHPGFARLYVFKDRDGGDELPVGGEPLGLLYDREYGFRVAPEAPERDLVAELREAGADGEWRTLKEWRAPKEKGGVGAREADLRAALSELCDSSEMEYTVGPPGRGRGAKCWRLITPAAGATEPLWHPVAPGGTSADEGPLAVGATAALPPEGGRAVPVAPPAPVPPPAGGTPPGSGGGE